MFALLRYFYKLVLDRILSVFLFDFLFRRRINDEYNDEVVELTKDETRIIRRLLKGKAPHAGFDPYPVCATCHHCAINLGLLIEGASM